MCLFNENPFARVSLHVEQMYFWGMVCLAGFDLMSVGLFAVEYPTSSMLSERILVTLKSLAIHFNIFLTKESLSMLFLSFCNDVKILVYLVGYWFNNFCLFFLI